MKLKKLTLNRETIRQLNSNDLRRVVGAYEPPPMELTFPTDGTMSAILCETCFCQTVGCATVACPPGGTGGGGVTAGCPSNLACSESCPPNC